MEKEFVPYEQALEFKELGFDEDCFGYYELQGKELVFRKIKNSIIYNWRDSFIKFSQCSAPTYQQAFRWFREKYKIECYINSYWNENDSSKRTYYTNYNYGSDIFYTIPKEFETHGEAELECLKKLIELCKKT